MSDRFDVFLSHNSLDKTAVERLAEKLRRAGLEPWLDKWHIPAGAKYQEALAAGLRASSACAYFIGPNGVGDWASEELDVAQNRAAKERTFRLFPVLLPGVGAVFDPKTLPPFLSTRNWVDIRKGVDDSRQFQQLINAIKGLAPGPETPLEPRTDICPYRGLQAFSEEHAEFFFGRDGEIQRLLERLKATRFLAVIGSSGSGKSSVVRAGLIPRIRAGALPGSESWKIQILTPGAHPLTALAAHFLRAFPEGAMARTLDDLSRDPRALHLAGALAVADRPPGELVVWVIDQFEEVFTLCRDEQERKQFLDNLLYAASIPDGRSMVIVTMRADFYPKCAAHADLSARIAAQQFLVSPMDLDGLRQAIEEPAWRVGLEFEEGLAATVLDDIANEPGSLPLLEHALLELWERRRGQMMTLEGYRESGGVQGAIAKRADTVYAAFDEAQQAIVRRIMLRLTQPGEGTEDTRRRATMSELITGPGESEAVETVVRTMADARLLTLGAGEQPGERLVDVSHEALIRGWPLLRKWIDEDRSSLRVHRRLTEASQEWERLNQEEGILYRGARLAQAAELRDGKKVMLNESERQFLDASVALQDREENERQERQQRELAQAQALAAEQTKRADEQTKAAARQRKLTWVMVALLLVASVVAFFAWSKQRQATEATAKEKEAKAGAVREANNAESARKSAEKDKVAAEAAKADALKATGAAQEALTRSFVRTIGVSSKQEPMPVDERAALWELAELDPANRPVREKVIDHWFQTTESFRRAVNREAQGLNAAVGFSVPLRDLATSRINRIADQLASALENPQGNDSNRLSSLGSALAALAVCIAPKEAASIADRFAKALENPRKTDDYTGWDPLSESTSAFAALAARMDPKAASSVADRLAKALENPQQTDNNRMYGLRSALAAVAPRVEREAAASIADRLTKTVENPQETNYDRLSELGLALEALAARMEPKEAAAARVGQLLAKALENSQETDTYRLTKLDNALLELAPRMEPKEIKSLANRLAKALKDPKQKPKALIFSHLVGLLEPLSKTAASAAASRAQEPAKALENPQETDADALRHLANAGMLRSHEPSWLAALAARIRPEEVASIADGLVQAVEYRDIDSGRLSDCGGALAALAVRMDPKEVASIAIRLATALENRQEDKVTERVLYRMAGLGRTVAALAALLGPKEFARIAAWDAQSLIKVLETPKGTDDLIGTTVGMSELRLSFEGVSRLLPDARQTQLTALSNILLEETDNPPNPQAGNYEQRLRQRKQLVELSADMFARLGVQDLTEVLKWPFCMGEAQKLALAEMEKKTGGKFDGDLWKFVEQAPSLGIKDLDAPAQRPRIEDAINELEKIVAAGANK